MNDLTIARAIHVIAVVLWIGGVGMVTTVLLPAIRQFKSAQDRVAFFERIERRFAWQARGTTLVTGASGFFMVQRLGLWSQFGSGHYWYLDAMVGVWAVFTVMLFVAEPLFLDRWFALRAGRDPIRVFTIIQRLHWVLLVLSLIAVGGAVAGAHGLSFFG